MMGGMRNRIAHGYLLVDAGIVRRTLEHDIPPIVARITDRLV
ncbi:MAG: HepT-like ribonuclease domain-containing protein [Propionicimonas sp.]